MTATPFFSVLIPTRNRSTLVVDTVQSILNQTFGDYEIVISDNDESDATQRVIEKFDDPRIRYFRVNNLSMDQNWDYACQQAKGEFVTILPDKRVFRRMSLEYLARVIEKTQAKVVSWQVDTIDDVEPDQMFFKKNRLPWDNNFQWHETPQLIDTFLKTNHRKTLLILPRGLNSAYHRSVVEKHLQTPGNHVCYPVMPDYTMSYVQLAFVDRILHIPHALALSRISVGNGRSVRYQTDMTVRKNFMAGFGGEAVSHTHVPIKAFSAQNGIYNDFLNLQELIGGNLSGHELPLEAYFVTVYQDTLHSGIYGGYITDALTQWEVALAQQPIELQKAVRQAVRPIALKYQSMTLGYRVNLLPVQRVYRRLRKGRYSPLFSGILDAVAWEEPQLNANQALQQVSS